MWSSIGISPRCPCLPGAFADDKEGLGYGMFEQWIPRIGNIISRSDDDAPFHADGLVVICPQFSVSDDYLRTIDPYVEQGGQVLVLDSPDVPDSTVNSLLSPFGLTLRREAAEQVGTVQGPWRSPACQPWSCRHPARFEEARRWPKSVPARGSPGSLRPGAGDRHRFWLTF